MAVCRKLCRLLMVLLGLGCLTIVTFIFYDGAVNSEICRLHFVIIARFAIGFSTLYTSACCGLFPKPSIRMPRNWPTPWKLWKCCRSEPSVSDHEQTDAPIQPEASTSQAHNVNAPLVCQRDETSSQRQHTSAGASCQPETSMIEVPQEEVTYTDEHEIVSSPFYVLYPEIEEPRRKKKSRSSKRRERRFSFDLWQPDASTSQTDKIQIFPVFSERDETSSKTSGKHKEPKTVRFAAPEVDSVRSIRGDSDRECEAHREGTSRQSRKTDGSTRTERQSPKGRTGIVSLDNCKSRLKAMARELELLRMPKETDGDQSSLDLIEQNRERDDGLRNAASRQSPDSERSMHHEPDAAVHGRTPLHRPRRSTDSDLL